MSLYQQIQTIEISTSPFNISNFQFNTFECISGSGTINLPDYVVSGASFTIINKDINNKVIVGGLNIITLFSNQSVIIIADSITNKWISSSISSISSLSPYTIIGSSGNNPVAIASGTITLNTPLLYVGNTYFFKVGVTIFTTNYTIGNTTLEECFSNGTTLVPSISVNLVGAAGTFRTGLVINSTTSINYTLTSSGSILGYRIDIFPI